MPTHSGIVSNHPVVSIVLDPDQMPDEQYFAQQITALPIEHTI